MIFRIKRISQFKPSVLFSFILILQSAGSVAATDSHQFEASYLYSLTHQSERLEYDTSGAEIKAYFSEVPHGDNPLGETAFLEPRSSIFIAALKYEGDFKCPGACAGEYREEVSGSSNAIGVELVEGGWLIGATYFDIESEYDEFYLGVNGRSESNTRRAVILNLTSYIDKTSAVTFSYGRGEDDLNCTIDPFDCTQRTANVNLYEFTYKSVTVKKQADDYASGFKFNVKREQTDYDSYAEAGIYGDLFVSRTYHLGARLIHKAIDLQGNIIGVTLKVFVTESIFLDIDVESFRGDESRDVNTGAIIVGTQF